MEIWSKMCIGLHVKYTLFLSDFNDTLTFWADFRKIFKFQISWKSIQWELSCSMRTDRHDEANSRFSQFCESALNPKKKHLTACILPRVCAVLSIIHQI